MKKFDSLSGKILIKPLYFGLKQHTSLEGEPRYYNNQNFTNFKSKCYYKLSLRIQTEYLRSLKVDKFFRV